MVSAASMHLIFNDQRCAYLCVNYSGNIASGVGPFALDEGLVPVAPDQHEVRHFASSKFLAQLTRVG